MNIIEVFKTLDIMWKGMLGLFLVSIFIMLMVIVTKHIMQRNNKLPL